MSSADFAVRLSDSGDLAIWFGTIGGRLLWVGVDGLVGLTWADSPDEGEMVTRIMVLAVSACFLVFIFLHVRP